MGVLKNFNFSSKLKKFKALISSRVCPLYCGVLHTRKSDVVRRRAWLVGWATSSPLLNAGQVALPFEVTSEVFQSTPN